MKYWSLFVLALLALAVGLFLWLQHAPKIKSQVGSGQSTAAEQKFLQEMTAHHEAAINIASQAKEQADNPEIKSLAASMIAVEEKEVSNMSSWYERWYGSTIPKPATDPHAGHAPESNATTFDEGFVSIMIPHEENAVKLANEVRPKLIHQEVKDLAAAIVWRTPAEIDQMKKNQKSSTNDASLTINYNKSGFDKPNLTINAGVTVTFVNQRRDRPMWVASNVHPDHTIYPEFDQGRVLGYEPLPKDNIFTFTFKKRGRWVYHEHYDPTMTGVITVN